MSVKYGPDFLERISEDIDLHEKAYSILGINKVFDEQKIKKDYRKMAKIYHPDHNKNTLESNKQFRVIKCAYELLMDNKKCDLKMFKSYYVKNKDNMPSNSWSQFLWWKEKFFPEYKDIKKIKRTFCV